MLIFIRVKVRNILPRNISWLHLIIKVVKQW
jgi:hypothetical protein